jgi:cyclohexanone monooxygenase
MHIRSVEASAEAEAKWVETLIGLARLGQDFFESCTPGYYNNEGKPNDRSAQNGFYGGGPVQFFKLLEDWWAEGGLQGLGLS